MTINESRAAPLASPPVAGRRVAAVIATWFGAGLMPRAPGTWGTLAAVPFAWAFGRLGQAAFLIALLVVTVVGSWAADVYCRATGRHDNQRIVVDEVAGYFLTLALSPRTPVYLLLGFIFFRLFDITKPPPVRWIDRNVRGGFGVVADDLGAGVYAALVLLLLERTGATAFLGRLLGGGA
ncbi:MAG TPA: phosphatidylglycerophosphatase A [Polyangia bacterium]|jgi:phosphatidylglycerophosphatase A|nr:phosphatidylglycerophosphatase A [Polyangia bacterium]